MKCMASLLLFFFLQSWPMHQVSLSEHEGIESLLPNGTKFTLPKPFFDIVKSLVFCKKGKRNVIKSEFTAESIVLGYQIFILSLIACNKNDLFFPLLGDMPRDMSSLSSIFAYNTAAKKIFLQQQYTVMNRFKKLLYGNNERSFFTELDLSMLMNHWTTFQNFLHAVLPHSASGIESEAKASELLTGLVQSYCASFVRAQLDIHVARLLHKGFASHEMHTPFYVTTCCSVLAMQSKIFGSKKQRVMPAIQLLANFVYDQLFAEYVKKNHEIDALEAINPHNAFSIHALLKDDPFALKRICPAGRTSNKWGVRLAHIDLRDMGIRNVEGIYTAVKKCAKLEREVDFFPFFLRPIALLPEIIDVYMYAFTGINLAGNKMQDVWLPKKEFLQFDTSANYLFTVHVEDNPLRYFNYFVPITRLIVDKKQKNISEIFPDTHALLASHNSQALHFQRQFFKESHIGFDSESESWLRKKLLSAGNPSKKKVVKNIPFIGPWPKPSVVYPLDDVPMYPFVEMPQTDRCVRPKKLVIHMRTKSL